MATEPARSRLARSPPVAASAWRRDAGRHSGRPRPSPRRRAAGGGSVLPGRARARSRPRGAIRARSSSPPAATTTTWASIPGQGRRLSPPAPKTPGSGVDRHRAERSRCRGRGRPAPSRRAFQRRQPREVGGSPIPGEPRFGSPAGPPEARGWAWDSRGRRSATAKCRGPPTGLPASAGYLRVRDEQDRGRLVRAHRQHLEFRPHPRSSSVRQILVHQILSERRFFAEFIGLSGAGSRRVLPPGARPRPAREYVKRLVDLARPRLAAMADRDEAFWLDRGPVLRRAPAADLGLLAASAPYRAPSRPGRDVPAAARGPGCRRPTAPARTRPGPGPTRPMTLDAARRGRT